MLSPTLCGVFFASNLSVLGRSETTWRLISTLKGVRFLSESRHLLQSSVDVADRLAIQLVDATLCWHAIA